MNAVRLDLMTLALALWTEDPLVAATSASSSPPIAPIRMDRELNSTHTTSSTTTENPSHPSEMDQNSTSFYVPGEFVELLPESPATVALPGVIKGTVKLSNPHARFWRVTIEGTVVLANGTTQPLLNPRTLWMLPMQTLKRPVQLKVDSSRFVPGLTQFRAILKDDQGQVIDQASIAFTLIVDFP
jgi:hypothetical protein